MSWAGKFSLSFSSKNSKISKLSTTSRDMTREYDWFSVSTWETTESTDGRFSFAFACPWKRALSPLFRMKLNIKNEKEPVQTGASLTNSLLTNFVHFSTQWNLQIREHSAGVQDVQGHPLPPISKRVARGTQKKAQKRKGYENRIKN